MDRVAGSMAFPEIDFTKFPTWYLHLPNIYEKKNIQKKKFFFREIEIFDYHHHYVKNIVS